MAICIVFLPLLMSIICYFFQSYLTKKSVGIISSISMSLVAVLSILMFLKINNTHSLISEDYQILFQWISIDLFEVNMGIYIDQLTALMWVIIAVISALTHTYSIGYMTNDVNFNKFMAYLSFFTFCMLILVSSNNFIQLFFGWEGVGVCSYLLINFWHQKKAASYAAFKAFIVNRVADICFILAIILLSNYCNTTNFDIIFKAASGLSWIDSGVFGLSVIDLAGILLLVACAGKSAQIGLHIWLPDAMEAPTPASALIHAATMVTAGIFLLARCSLIFHNTQMVSNLITILGMITCVVTAGIAIVQTDMKRVLAYSTCSQLGYMFLSCGIFSYKAAIFHLVTHAFSKALLFFTVGNVIYNTKYNTLKYSGVLYHKFLSTFVLFCIGALSIVGIFPLSGYYSKDSILLFAYSNNNLVFILPVFSTLLTATYLTKLGTIIYKENIKTTINFVVPKIMVYSSCILSFFVVFSGIYCYYGISILEDIGYLGTVVFQTNVVQNSYIITLLPLLYSILGSVGYVLFINNKNLLILLRSLNFFLRKRYLHKFYSLILIDNIFLLAKLCFKIENKIFDGIINSFVCIAQTATSKLKSVHNETILNYFFILTFVNTITISYFTIKGMF